MINWVNNIYTYFTKHFSKVIVNLNNRIFQLKKQWKICLIPFFTLSSKIENFYAFSFLCNCSSCSSRYLSSNVLKFIDSIHVCYRMFRIKNGADRINDSCIQTAKKLVHCKWKWLKFSHKCDWNEWFKKQTHKSAWNISVV